MIRLEPKLLTLLHQAVRLQPESAALLSIEI